MKKIIIAITLTFLASCSGNKPAKFLVTSSDIAKNSIIANKHVFEGFGCKGNNISPEISWENAPANTESFALTVYDPDAPTGSGWWHWVVVNIPKNTNQLKQNFGKHNKSYLKNGIRQIKNDYGKYSFGGPCPPVGDKLHEYIFTLHALKTKKLDINKNSSAALAGFMINANTIEKKSFSAYYGR